MKELIEEIRQEFQIPPYFPNDALKRYAEEGKKRLESLNPVSDFENDKTFQCLLKNYVNYAYYHKVNEWEENYASMILSWQLGSGAQDE